MIRTTSIAVLIVSLLLITAIVDGAGNPPSKRVPIVVEISAFQVKGAPTSQPVKGTLQSTIKALADQDGAYLAEVKLGDRVLHLSGKMEAADDKTWRVEVDYSDNSPGNVRSITSMIETPIEQPKTIAGMNGGDSSIAIVLALHEQKPAKE